MAKARKGTAAPKSPLMPQVGDKVKPGNSQMVYEISRVGQDGDEVDLHVPGTNLQRFRVRTDNITFVERKVPARTSNPFTSPEPMRDLSEVLERISAVKNENLQRLDDDIAILAKYLKTEGTPKAVISALEDLSSEQHEGWKTAVERIEELLEE